MADIGYAALFLTFLTTLYATVAILLGKRFRAEELLRSARNGIWAGAVLATIASGILLYLLVRLGARFVLFIGCFSHTGKFGVGLTKFAFSLCLLLSCGIELLATRLELLRLGCELLLSRVGLGLCTRRHALRSRGGSVRHGGDEHLDSRGLARRQPGRGDVACERCAD